MAGRVQADCGRESGTSGLRTSLIGAVPVALGLLLSGCSSLPSSINPVSWWHDLQGGKIAEERPPPPGADQPYPNLATVPPKPAQPDRAAMANLSFGLIADRANAQHIAAAAPLADPSSSSASPGLFGKGSVTPPPPAPPPGTKMASASLPAADAPPPAPAPSPAAAPSSQPAAPAGPAAAPAKAPIGAVQSAPLAPPGAAMQATPEASPPPPLPAAPPPPPANLGAASPIPPAAASATPAPASVTALTTPPAASANTINITFIDGSALLPPTGADALKQLAARRGRGVIAVTGYGDATSSDPNAQATALTLGLSRAQAMAAALTAAGVPATAVQVDAAAIGRGGSARLVQ